MHGSESCFLYLFLASTTILPRNPFYAFISCFIECFGAVQFAWTCRPSPAITGLRLRGNSNKLCCGITIPIHHVSMANGIYLVRGVKYRISGAIKLVMSVASDQLKNRQIKWALVVYNHLCEHKASFIGSVHHIGTGWHPGITDVHAGKRWVVRFGNCLFKSHSVKLQDVQPSTKSLQKALPVSPLAVNGEISTSEYEMGSGSENPQLFDLRREVLLKVRLNLITWLANGSPLHIEILTNECTVHHTYHCRCGPWVFCTATRIT